MAVLELLTDSIRMPTGNGMPPYSRHRSAKRRCLHDQREMVDRWFMGIDEECCRGCQCSTRMGVVAIGMADELKSSTDDFKPMDSKPINTS